MQRSPLKNIRVLTFPDIATIPYKIFKEMIKHNLTDAGLKKFLEDFKSVKTKEK